MHHPWNSLLQLNGTTFSAEGKILLMTISTLDYAEKSIARSTCQLLTVRGRNLSCPQKGNFPAAHQNIFCTDDVGDSCSQAVDGSTEEINSPV